MILSIETFNLLHLKCHFDDKVAFRAQCRGSCGDGIWWRINEWAQQSCRHIIANRERLDSRNHCKKSLWPTRPNPICEIVPFHLISWNYFVCNVVHTNDYRVDRQTLPVRMRTTAGARGERVWRMGLWRAHTHTGRGSRRLSECIYLIEELTVSWKRALCEHEWTDIEHSRTESLNSEWRCTMHTWKYWWAHSERNFSLFIFADAVSGAATAPFSIHSFNLENFAVGECRVLQTPLPLPIRSWMPYSHGFY